MRAVTGLAVAGLGGLGEALIRDVAQFAGELRVVAVQDVRQDVAERVARAHGVGAICMRFEDLLEVPGVDAVAICTPNGLHVPQAQAALRKGKHALVQKPLALSQTDARATLDLAELHQRLLFVDYSYRFLETMAIFQEAIAGLGAVRSARGEFHNIYGPGSEKTWFFDPRLSGGGALVDLGVHLLDLALWVLQPRQARLLAADLAGDEPVESAASLAFELDQTRYDLAVSWNAARPATEIFFEVYGENGTIVRWENVDGSFFRFRTVRDGVVLLDRETTLRADTLRAFCQALARGRAPAIDVRVYALLDRAYRRPVASP